jgi:DNA adenine methylase
MSEFDNPAILDLAKEYGLNVITIGERKNMKNRRTEILLTNYPAPVSAAAQGNLFG